MKKIIELLLVLIITIPSFFNLLNNQYFSMHDNQHIVRLYLLDQGMKQGSIFPRWVDGLGFGYGYPLFNFYPPLVYYLGELIHLMGLSLIWSVKLVFIFGFVLSAIGIYLFAKKFMSSAGAILSSVLYTYFFYHAVNIYVRGALAEFFSMAIIPFVFLSIVNLAKSTSFKNSVLFGVIFAILILNHPLIAFPSFFYISFFLIFYLLTIKKNRLTFLKYCLLGGLIALGLSAFFWLPSFYERKFTMVDEILTKELANYKLHYIYPIQFLYSLWGYGGSIAGPNDGMTFQLGKIHITLLLLSILVFYIYFLKKKKLDNTIKNFLFFVYLLFFSLFMATEYSSFIWDNLKYLWYLQFPWRFLTFAGFFISLIASYFIIFSKTMRYFLVVLISFTMILVYQKYFKPQTLVKTNDMLLTSYNEIVWKISRTSFEFVPKGVRTMKSDLNTTILDIGKNDLPKAPYQIISGKAIVQTVKNDFQIKKFLINAENPSIVRLNTYNFPGWEAYLNNKKIQIEDNNSLKLITLKVPKGENNLSIEFKNTPVRTISNSISLGFLIVLIVFWIKSICYNLILNSKKEE